MCKWMTLSKGKFLKERKSSNDGTWGNPTLENGEKEGTCWVNVIKNKSPLNPEGLSPKIERKQFHY